MAAAGHAPRGPMRATLLRDGTDVVQISFTVPFRAGRVPTLVLNVIKEPGDHAGHVWYGSMKALDVHIAVLRKKPADPR